jgi:hypothetical protein
MSGDDPTQCAISMQMQLETAQFLRKFPAFGPQIIGMIIRMKTLLTNVNQHLFFSTIDSREGDPKTCPQSGQPINFHLNMNLTH